MKIPNPLPIGRTLEVKLNSVPEKRLLYIDNIRWLMIVFVVMIHLNCTYGNVGRWYYQETGASDIFSVVFFGMFGSLTQSYFMGFLFFIAGFFVPGSYDKKGCGRFIGERLIMLGIPTLVYMLFLHPLTMAIIFANNHFSLDILCRYRQYLFSLEFIGAFGPLWFALALLIFSVIYAMVRTVRNQHHSRIPIDPFALAIRQVVVSARLISGNTALGFINGIRRSRNGLDAFYRGYALASRGLRHLGIIFLYRSLSGSAGVISR
jgi:fucose 4-O-acetylase-like acetyltransferase